MKNKKGHHKLSEETKEKLRIQEEIRKKEEEEEKNKDEKSIKKEEKKKKKLERKIEKKKKREENKISIPKTLETIFDIVYLGFLIISIFNFFSLANSNKAFIILGCLTVVLTFGDFFHLAPRILNNMKKNGIENKDFWFGLGTQISSITITWFYLLLYFLYKKLFPENLPGLAFEIAIWGTVILRILICLLPQNNWYTKDRNIVTSIIRNLIFLITGILEIVLFAKIGNKGGYGFWTVSVAIGLSFIFYLPVSFGVKKYKKLGVLMIPKTLCYIWIICIGLNLIGKV